MSSPVPSGGVLGLAPRPGRVRPRLVGDVLLAVLSSRLVTALADRNRWVHLTGPLVAALAVRSWHTPGHFVAGGDIAPFHRRGQAADLGEFWGYGLTGAGSPTAEIARLPEVVLARGGELLGVAPELAQLAYFWLWLALASIAVVSLIRALVPSPVAAVVTGVLTVANPLMAVNLPNPLVACAVAVLAGVAGVAVRLTRGEASVRRAVLVTLPASYLAINPPTLAVVLVGSAALLTAAFAVAPRRSEVAGLLGRAGGLAVLVHLWWLVPTAIVYGAGEASVAAVTDPEAWSWTHVNNSLRNVVTMTAHWGWGLHEYLPFSRRLDAWPLAPMRWALPLLWLASPLMAADRTRRRIAWTAVAVASTAMILGKGLHAPFGELNLALYRHVPGMWLLREPMSKVGPLILLGQLVGVAVTIDGARTWPERARRRFGRAGAGRLRPLPIVVAALTAAAIAFGHPVLVGAVAPHDRTPLPPSRVDVPAAWTELAASVNGDDLHGKALVLPELPFYQATTTWGFHGAATLPRDLFARPTILGLPGGYFSDDPVVAGLVSTVGASRDAATVRRALDALGVSHVVVRRDLSPAQAVHPVADAAELVDALMATGDFERADHGVATVLRRPGGRTVRAFTETAHVGRSPGESSATAIASLPDDVAAVAYTAAFANRTPRASLASGGGSVQVPVPPGRHRVEVRPTGDATVELHRVGAGLRLDLGTSVRVGDQVTDGVVDVVADDGRPVLGARVGATTRLVGEHPVTVPLRPGAEVDLVVEAGEPVPFPAWSEVGDCAAVDATTPQLGSAVRHTPRTGQVIELTATGHAACVSAAAPVDGVLALRLAVQVLEGTGARACLWSHAAAQCVWEQRVDAAAGEWQLAGDVVDVPQGAELFLYADAGDGPSMVRYLGPALVPVTIEPVDLGAVEETWVTGTGTSVRVSLVDRPGHGSLGGPSELGNCNRMSGAGHLAAVPLDGGVRLEATADAACVSYAVPPLLPGVGYDVSFEYRTRSPGPARWCMWLEGPDRCANRDLGLAPAPEWTEHVERVEVPDDVRDVRLYVYADGRLERPMTVNEYRTPSIRSAAAMVVRLEAEPTPGSETSAGTSATPDVLEVSGWGDRRRIRVRAGGAPFLLALPESADRGWELTGLPDRARAYPTTVDGYQQGWFVVGVSGDLDLVARYRPGQTAALARWTSGLTAAGLFGPGFGGVAPLVGRLRRRFGVGVDR